MVILGGNGFHVVPPSVEDHQPWIVPVYPETVKLPFEPLQVNDELSVPPFGPGVIVMVPDAVNVAQLPVEVMVYGYAPGVTLINGVPLMVNVFPESTPLIPAGKPEAEAEIIVPPIV